MTNAPLPALATRLSSIAPSVITSIAETSRRLASEGHDICNLSVGEPGFPTVTAASEAGLNAIRDGETTYPRTQGALPLVDAIRTRYEADYGVSVGRDRVIVSNGAKQVLFNAFQALLNPGAEVIVPSPYWTSYVDIIGLCGGVALSAPAVADGTLEPDVAAMSDLVGKKTACILLNSPCNPSGNVISDRTMSAIFELMRKTPSLFLICDEIYDKIVFDDIRFRTALAQAPDLQDRILVINGVSKTYAMTGWRVGYGVGPQRVVSAMALVQGQSTSGSCSISQAAAAAALAGRQADVVARCKIYQSHRDIIVNALTRDCGLSFPPPQGAFYVFPDFSDFMGRHHRKAGQIDDDIEFCNALLETRLLALVPGSAFGTPGRIRISAAASREAIVDGMARLAAFVAEFD